VECVERTNKRIFDRAQKSELQVASAAKDEIDLFYLWAVVCFLVSFASYLACGLRPFGFRLS
jgi:hypothetical protein